MQAQLDNCTSRAQSDILRSFWVARVLLGTFSLSREVAVDKSLSTISIEQRLCRIRGEYLDSAGDMQG